MMPTRAEIERSLRAALLLARGDPAGMGQFELTVGGFWKSFAAPLIAAPAYAFLIAEQHLRAAAALPPGAAPGLGRILAGEGPAYLLDVVAFPLLAIPLTRFLGLGARYVPLVVATNWATLPQIALFLGAVLAGLLVPPLRPPLMLTAMMVSLTYQWFVVRLSLGTAGTTATALVIINLLVGIGLNVALDTLLYPDRFVGAEAPPPPAE